MNPSGDQGALRGWLRDQEATPSYLDDVLALTRHERQRRRWWPAVMAPPMVGQVPGALRFAAAAATVVAVLVGVASVASPRHDRSAAGAPIVAPTPDPTRLPTFVGSVVQADAFRAPFSITIPDGWTVADRYEPDSFFALRPLAHDPLSPEVGIDLTVVENVTVDPCSRDGREMRPGIGPTAADLAAWLASIEELRASDPVPVRVAGFDAYRVDEHFGETARCGPMLLWNTNAGEVYDEEVKRFHIFEVGVHRVVAVVVRHQSTPESEEALAYAVLDTLTFR